MSKADEIKQAQLIADPTERMRKINEIINKYHKEKKDGKDEKVAPDRNKP